MPPEREWRLRVEDILESIGKIQDYTSGMGFEAFAWDDRTADAVLRNLGVIGEAANHVPGSVRRRHPDLPWEAMRAMRNFVIHEYFGVSKEILWKTVLDDLPPLVPALQRMLDTDRGASGQGAPGGPGIGSAES